MPKSSSKDLFIFIKSLSKSEKWHFKLYASGTKSDGPNHYVRLFDAIEKQKEYDEKALLQTEKYITQLPLLKNRLYEVILESLDVLYAKQSVDSKLMRFIHYAEILFEKGLFDQCERILHRAKDLATKYERFLFLAEIIKLEIDLMGARTYVGTTEQDIKNAFREISNAIEKDQQINKFNKYSSELFIKLKKEGFTRTSKQKEAFQKIIDIIPPIEDEREAPFMANFYHHQSNIVYQLSRNDTRKRYLYLNKQLHQFAGRPDYIKEFPLMYQGVLHNLTLCLLDLGKPNEALAAVEKIRSIPAKTDRLKARIYYSYMYLSLTLYVNTGDFELGAELINKLTKEGFDEYAPKNLIKQNVLSLYYFIAYTYFGNQQFQKSNQFLNRILNDPDRTEDDLRSDLYCFTRIFGIILHFELGKLDLLEYTIKSVYRYLLKRNRLYKFETVILNFLRKNSSKTSSQKQLLTAFKQLKAEIEEVTKDEYEHRALSYFDFISWLDSKIEDRTFAEVIFEKANK